MLTAASHSTKARSSSGAAGTTDPFQQWRFHGSGQLNVNGNANAVLHSQGTRATCLAGDSAASGNRAPIVQWLCNRNDIFQQWN